MDNLTAISKLKRSKQSITLKVKDQDVEDGYYFVSGFVYAIEPSYVRLASDESGRIKNVEYKNILEIR